MTLESLARQVEPCTVEDISSGRRIGIEIFAPDGMRFKDGPHSHITEWAKPSRMADLIKEAWEDHQTRGEIECCPMDCECRDEGK